MEIKKSPTFWVKVYLSGPIAVAEQVLREECWAGGLCVTVEPTKFIYTGGEEVGYVVGLVNYPRFPSSQEALIGRAESIAVRLMERTFQGSALVISPSETKWISRRDEVSR